MAGGGGGWVGGQTHHVAEVSVPASSFDSGALTAVFTTRSELWDCPRYRQAPQREEAISDNDGNNRI